MLLTKPILKSFQKKREASSSCHALLWSCFLYHVMLCFDLAMLLLTKSAPKTKIFSSTIDSPRFGDKKEKFTIHYHYSSVTIYDTVHFKIFAYLRGVVPYIWNKFYFRSSSLERVPSSELIVSLSLREFFTTIPISLQSL